MFPDSSFEISALFAYLPSAATWHSLVAAYKALAAVVSFFAVVGIVIVLVRSVEFSRRMQAKKVREAMDRQAGIATESETGEKIARDAWAEIIRKLEAHPEEGYRVAIIEADALVDSILKAYGYAGETIAERLRSLPPGELQILTHLWEAHKLRNEIVHDPTYKFDARRGHETLRIYKQALTELGAL